MMYLAIIEAPGKTGLWKHLMSECGVKGEVIATGGHVARYPDDILSLGFSFRRNGKGRLLIEESQRKDDTVIVRFIAATAARLKPDLAAIYIAADDDDEGHVIAWDIARALVASDRSLAGLIRRLVPKTMTRNGMAAAISQAVPLNPLQLAAAAIPGRSRAIMDRWIASALRSPGVTVGRVRNAVIGGIAMIEKGEIPQSRIETGEIILKARCSIGARQAIARIACHGRPDGRLADIAKTFANNLVPGVVRPLQAAGAMPVTRIGRPAQPGTAETLVIASRHHGIEPRKAMEGLQKAYMDGLISYPRVGAGEPETSTFDDTRRIAEAMGLTIEIGEGNATRSGHDPLHPVFHPDGREGNAGWWMDVISLPDNLSPSMDPVNGIRDRLASIVARRSIEAAMPLTSTPGSWEDEGSTIESDRREVLENLDWVIESGPRPTWPRSLSTGARPWPASSQLIEFMDSEQLGKPSTFANHAESLISSGDLAFDPWELPRLQPAGTATINGPASHVSKPEVSRRLEDLLRISALEMQELLRETGELNLAEAIAGAVVHMADSLDPETRLSMMKYANLDLDPDADVDSEAQVEVISQSDPSHSQDPLPEIPARIPSSPLPDDSPDPSWPDF